MSGRRAGPARPRTLAAIAILCGLSAGCGTTYYEIPVETPIRPKLDISRFQRVLVAGFLAGGNDDVDANQETVRLLRSQLRTKSALRVIDADPLPLVRIVQSQSRAANPTSGPEAETQGNAGGSTGQSESLPVAIKTPRDIEQYERLFANTAYWKELGEEYQNPLIVTGSVLFTDQTSSSMVTRQRETVDAFGRRQVENQRQLQEQHGYLLRPKFVFIDGQTGAVIYTELHQEDIYYSLDQNIPPLSTYFELMDRVIPNFLGALSSQKVRGLRVLMK